MIQFFFRDDEELPEEDVNKYPIVKEVSWKCGVQVSSHIWPDAESIIMLKRKKELVLKEWKRNENQNMLKGQKYQKNFNR